MRKEFRQPKYLNETGSKVGNWYINKLDYFEFYRYPGYTKHKVYCAFLLVFSVWALPHVYALSGWLIFGLVYIFAAAGVTLTVLHRQICKYHGHLFLPKRFVTFWLTVKKEPPVHDFDTLATLQKSGTDKFVVKKHYDHQMNKH